MTRTRIHIIAAMSYTVYVVLCTVSIRCTVRSSISSAYNVVLPYERTSSQFQSDVKNRGRHMSTAMT
jgi:hypothetical protein